LDKAQKAILALLKTHQPMMANNLVKIVANESGTPSDVKKAYFNLIDTNKITAHDNGFVTLHK
jgi:hypothetical protein